MRFHSIVLLVSVLSVLVAAPAVRAQTYPAAPVTGTGSLSFVLGIPTGDFADNVDGIGYGGSLFVGAQLGASPLVLGLDVAFLTYGRDVDRVPFSQTVGPRVLVDVVTTNNIVQPHLVARLQLPSGVLRPYVEGLAGFKYLFTESRIEDVDFNDDRDIASTTNFDDFALSAGGGLGFDVRVYRPAPDADTEMRSLSIHLGVQYIFGQEAEYLDRGALTDADGDGRLEREELDVRRSQTNLVIPKLGLSARF